MTPDAPELDEASLRHALPLAAGRSRTPAGFALALGAYALRYGRTLVSPAAWRGQEPAPPTGRHAYYGATLQQRRALERIAALDPQALWVDREAMPRNRVLRLGLAALPAVWRRYRDGSPELRARLAADPRQGVLAVAYGVAWREWLSRARPACLVVASDTALGARVAVDAARRAGVPTVYVQHGCVTPAAPALTADYALLDGEQALAVYRGCGLGATQPSLVGVARLGGARVNAGADSGVVAVCGGHLTPARLLLRIARLLQRRLPARRVVLRPHPRQLGSAAFRLLLRLAGMPVSDARRVAAREFLEGAAVIVAGSSSILMEAAALGAASVYYRPLDARASAPLRNETALDVSRVDPADYYGFVAAGLCAVADDETGLLAAVASAAPGTAGLRLRAKPYCATIGGPHDGRSHELAARCIGLAARREPLPLRWDS